MRSSTNSLIMLFVLGTLRNSRGAKREVLMHFVGKPLEYELESRTPTCATRHFAMGTKKPM